MTLLEVLNVANNGYLGGGPRKHFDPETGELVGRNRDALSEFVVNEIAATYEGKSDADNLSRAILVIQTAQGALGDVIEALTLQLLQTARGGLDDVIEGLWESR